MNDIVRRFELEISKFYNAPYAVAVDSCTHAIELSLRYTKIKKTSCPAHTYISIPFIFEKLNLKWSFENYYWEDYYFLGESNIVDAAVYWQRNGYIQNTFMCLSFQYQKHLSLSRGGMILCDKEHDYSILKKMSYDGRMSGIPWRQQNIDTMGFHYYMTPETAEIGLKKFSEVADKDPKKWKSTEYPYLPDMKIFNKLNNGVVLSKKRV